MNDITPERVIGPLGIGFWNSKTPALAVELGVFTELAKGPADLAELSRPLGLHDRSARDFLDALVALDMLERDGETYREHAGDGPLLSTGPSRPISAGFWKWPMPGSIGSGAV